MVKKILLLLGVLVKQLVNKELEPRIISASIVSVTICKNIVFHHRNISLEFSEKEWAHFRAAVNTLGQAVEQTCDNQSYVEGDPAYNVEIGFDEKISCNSSYNSNTFSIELSDNNTVNINYRNSNVELTIQEFNDIKNSFINLPESEKKNE